MHGHCSRYPDDSRLGIPVFEIWIFVVWANFFMKKIRWHSPERKKAKSPRYRTADALNPLSINMVDCCCACLLRIGCDAFHLIPRIWRRSTSIFDSYVMCWIPKRSRITPPFTHSTLYTYIYATIGGLRADEIRAESVAAIGAQKWGRNKMCLFLRLRVRCLIFVE